MQSRVRGVGRSGKKYCGCFFRIWFDLVVVFAGDPSVSSFFYFVCVCVCVVVWTSSGLCGYDVGTLTSVVYVQPERRRGGRCGERKGGKLYSTVDVQYLYYRILVAWVPSKPMEVLRIRYCIRHLMLAGCALTAEKRERQIAGAATCQVCIHRLRILSRLSTSPTSMLLYLMHVYHSTVTIPYRGSRYSM